MLIHNVSLGGNTIFCDGGWDRVDSDEVICNEDRTVYVKKLDKTFTLEEFKTRFRICDHCRCLIDTETDGCGVHTDDDYDYCNDCAEEHTWCCYYCGDILSENSYSNYTEDTENCFCEFCRDDNRVSYCDRCESYYEHRNVRYVEEAEMDMCDDCYNEYIAETEERERRAEESCDPLEIRRYHHHKRITRFYKNDDEPEEHEKTLYIGAEIEVSKLDGTEDDEWRRNYISKAYTYEGLPKLFVIAERDSSLNPYTGVENITQPASVKYHTETLKGFYTHFFKTIRDFGYDDDSIECGLHMHIDNAYFGKKPERARAILCLIFMHHWDNLQKFARRCEDKCDWCSDLRSHIEHDNDGYDIRKGWDTFKEVCDEYIKRKSYFHNDRYFCVNVTNENTTEIRLWSGTLDVDTFFATIKMTARLAEIAKTSNLIKVYKMSWNDILGDDPDILAYWETVKNKNFKTEGGAQ